MSDIAIPDLGEATIGWNASLLRGEMTGVETYIYRILRALGNTKARNNLRLFGPVKSLYRDIGFEGDPPDSAPGSKLWRILWEQTALPLKAYSEGVDLLHCPTHLVPLWNRSKTVVTVHDLAFEHFPGSYERHVRAFLRKAVPLSLNRADAIIAVSENTKEDLENIYGIDPAKVRVIYNGVNSEFREIEGSEEINRLKKEYELPKKFILYLGTLEPRKNIKRIIKAYRAYRDNERTKTKLVVAGGKGWLYEDIFELVEEEGLGSEVVFTGYVENEELVSLYNLAESLIFPSLYEGFGFPVLEAMACGTPVITSNVSSLPEVAGEAAILVDPREVEEIVKGISLVLHDRDLRNELVEKGKKRAAEFTWEKSARGHLEVYRELLEDG